MSPRAIEKVVRFFELFEGMLKKRPSEVKAIIILLGCFWTTNFVPMATGHHNKRPWEGTVQNTVAGRHVVELKFSDPNSAEALNWAMKNRIPTYKDEPLVWETEGIKAFALKRLNWLLIFYLRSLPLVALLYLSRMARRKGILATVLAGKLRFALAIAGWPIMIFRYPHNILREIVVIAELSRLKSPFSRLTKREQEIVQEVASDGRCFKKWRADFRLTNNSSLRRGFALALVITILTLLVAPSLSRASGGNKVGAIHELPLQITCVNSPPGTCLVSSNGSPTSSGQHDWSFGIGVAGLPQSLLCIGMGVVGVVGALRVLKPLIVALLIFYIPKISPVFVLR